MIMPSVKERDGALITMYGVLMSLTHPEIMLLKIFQNSPAHHQKRLKKYLGNTVLRLYERQQEDFAQGYQGYRKTGTIRVFFLKRVLRLSDACIKQSEDHCRERGVVMQQ